MRHTASLVSFFALVLALGAQGADMGQKLEPEDALPPESKGQAWKRVWHDEFDAAKLDEIIAFTKDNSF